MSLQRKKEGAVSVAYRFKTALGRDDVDEARFDGF
jgi:hypothetical protein